MKKKIKIFIDFDGTITSTDVGENIFLKFGDKEKALNIIEDLLSDKISSKDCWEYLCESIPHIDKNQLDIFIDEINIDPAFKNFISFCKVNKMEHYILSDGFDYYLERILSKEGLYDIKYFSNVLQVINNKLKPSFPYLDIDCPESANCKRNHILNNSGDEEYTIYIGDGNSDRYAAQFCDFIFAKNDLLKYCEKERISYYPFKNFNDVQQVLLKLLSQKRLKKRHQAVLKRQEVYMRE